jgi:hypothetical protein
MNFDNEADFSEWIVITHGIIKAFEDRGYALYSVGTSDAPAFIGSKDLLGELVSFGPTTDVLEPGFRFIPLPLVAKGQRSDPVAVFAAVDLMIHSMRGPYFIDLQTDEKDGSVTPIGSHLVDSLLIEPPFLYLVIDSRFGSGRTGSIELHLATAAHKIRGQLMLALRANSIPLETGKLQ